jgi:peptidoglycan hydrolase-like protein with peptidoglycan-binding domain
VRKRNRRESTDETNGAGRLSAAINRHPREFVAIVMTTVAVFAIFINALFLQHGPHPAPIFATRPLVTPQQPVALPRPRVVEPRLVPLPPARIQAQIIGDIQRELGRKGFYDGPADGIWGAKTDSAARDFVQAAGITSNAEASESLLQAIANSNAKPPSGRSTLAEPARNDPIAELIAPPKQVLAVQRVLADFAYGQITPTGVLDAATQRAIAKFERERQLPVTGQISDRLLRELSAMTGRPLE